MSNHREALREATRAYNERDVAGILAHYHPDAEVVSMMEGTFRGHEQLVKLWREQWDQLDTTMEITEMEELDRDRVLGGAVFTAQAAGIEQRQELGWVFRFREEKVVRAEVFASLGEARAAAPG